MTNEEKAFAVLSTYSEGGRLKDALEQHGLASTTFWRIRKQSVKVETEYGRARTIRADLFADEVVYTAERSDLDPQDKKVRMDGYKWAAGVSNRQVYGDKIDMNVSGQVDLRAALTAHQAQRLRLASDSHAIEEAEVIESQAITLPQPTDRQSETPQQVRPPCNPFDD